MCMYIYIYIHEGMYVYCIYHIYIILYYMYILYYILLRNPWTSTNHEHLLFLVYDPVPAGWWKVSSHIFLLSETMLVSMGWLKGKSTGNHRFSNEIWDFPVIFPSNQPIDGRSLLSKGCTEGFLEHHRWRREESICGWSFSRHPSPI